jgi:hypothetical protein
MNTYTEILQKTFAAAMIKVREIESDLVQEDEGTLDTDPPVEVKETGTDIAETQELTAE